MEDTSLIRLAITRGFVPDTQPETPRQEQMELANRGLTRTLWDLRLQHKLLRCPIQTGKDMATLMHKRMNEESA